MVSFSIATVAKKEVSQPLMAASVYHKQFEKQVGEVGK